MFPRLSPRIHERLAAGQVIPALPLALNSERRLDEAAQRALFRYYFASGAGGIAVGVHTTQFAIREPQIGLFEPLLQLAKEEIDRAESITSVPLIRIGGICGATAQAAAEAECLRANRFQAGLISLSALRDRPLEALLEHCRELAHSIPLIGFYLQPAVGGLRLPYIFWRRFAEIENVVAIKIAPFNRYHTLDVIRAITESGRDDIALYTGNDDQILLDLLTPFRFEVQGVPVERRMVGGLLGQWAVWTRTTVDMLSECHAFARTRAAIPPLWLQLNAQMTDANAALFDAANGFAGCIAGLHEILHRQGLLRGTWCLDPKEGLSPGQREEIERVCRAYPHLNDDAFVAQHRAEWFQA